MIEIQSTTVKDAWRVGDYIGIPKIIWKGVARRTVKDLLPENANFTQVLEVSGKYLRLLWDNCWYEVNGIGKSYIIREFISTGSMVEGEFRFVSQDSKPEIGNWVRLPDGGDRGIILEIEDSTVNRSTSPDKDIEYLIYWPVVDHNGWYRIGRTGPSIVENGQDKTFLLEGKVKRIEDPRWKETRDDEFTYRNYPVEGDLISINVDVTCTKIISDQEIHWSIGRVTDVSGFTPCFEHPGGYYRVYTIAFSEKTFNLCRFAPPVEGKNGKVFVALN